MEPLRRRGARTVTVELRTADNSRQGMKASAGRADPLTHAFSIAAVL